VLVADMPWREAIVAVLRDEGAPMHYAEITQAIIDNEYRESVGATPAATVSSNLTGLTRGGTRSPVVKIERGVYALRDPAGKSAPKQIAEIDEAQEDAREMGLINAFGMFWDRDKVHWTPAMPRLRGVHSPAVRL
jgi:hypothetical protein